MAIFFHVNVLKFKFVRQVAAFLFVVIVKHMELVMESSMLLDSGRSSLDGDWSVAVFGVLLSY